MKHTRLFYPLVFGLLVWGMQGCSAQEMPTPSFGELIRHADFPSQFVGKRNIDVWLPEGYPNDAAYGVLYMHDGQNLYDSTVTWNHQEWMVDEVLTELAGKEKTPPMVVVGIFNNGDMRHAEYFPEKPFNLMTKKEITSLEDKIGKEKLERFRKVNCSDDYLAFIVGELKPFIDSTYATLPDQENTFIAGSSMGGLISMYAICEYPGVFRGAGCLSTHWPGFEDYPGNPVPEAFVRYLDKNLPPPGSHRIWFDHGTETLDATYAPHQRKIDEVIQKHGYRSSQWITKVYPGANHSERAWQKRLDEMLLFILGK